MSKKTTIQSIGEQHTTPRTTDGEESAGIGNKASTKNGKSRTKMRNRKNAEGPPSNTSEQESPGNAAQEAEKRLEALRSMQKKVRNALNKAHGRFGKSDPKQWEQRAILMLFGLVYQHLAWGDAVVSTEDLGEFAKMLLQRGRTQADKTGRKGRKSGEAKETGGEAIPPDELAELVQQVYGVNLDVGAK